MIKTVNKLVDQILSAYKHGLEDAFEMCLAECSTKNVEEVKKQIENVLKLLKEEKIERINQIIGNVKNH